MNVGEEQAILPTKNYKWKASEFNEYEFSFTFTSQITYTHQTKSKKNN